MSRIDREMLGSRAFAALVWVRVGLLLGPFASMAGVAAVYTVSPGESIQAAIDAASYGDTIEVAEGTYVENITLKNGVVLVGAGASSTIIDGAGIGSVVVSHGCDGSTTLEGFTITNGHADRGGGMHNEASRLTVRACVFAENLANERGGGMYNRGGGPTIINCSFSQNAVVGDHSGGGGMHNLESAPILGDCTFRENRAEGWYTHGGGLDDLRSDSILSDCVFAGNAAGETGGGMHSEDSSPALTGCILRENSAQIGGGMYCDSWHAPAAGNHTTLTDCTFEENSSSVAGGGMYVTYCDSTLADCTFESNTTDGSIAGGGGFLNDRCTATLSGCDFRGNAAASGSGGGLFNALHSIVKATSCSFAGNLARYDGCGMYNRGTATVISSIFRSNSGRLYTHSAGGGLSDRGLSCMVVNCVFQDNDAGFGGGMNNRDSMSVAVINCTFSGNSAGIDGGGMFNRDCHPVVTNSILWGNLGEQICNYYGTANPIVTYSCVQGGYPGMGNISNNPKFASHELHLQGNSPCIDAGNNDGLPADTLDIDGDGDTSEPIPWDRALKLRRADDPAVEPDPGNAGSMGTPVVDVGAYEVSPIFVDDNAPSRGDGRSWATAYKYLQDALFAAADPIGGRGEIRVAQGTYYPDQSEWGRVTPGDREASFHLQNNLAISGGYRGLAGTGDPDDRDMTMFETVLTGDYAGNDDPGDSDSTNENSYHIMSSRDTDTSAVLDGFTITGGNADGEGISERATGGGLFNNGGSPVLSSCIFVGNLAGYGGGVYTERGGPTISDCTFTANCAGHGGGLYAKHDGLELTLTGCLFRENSASGGAGATIDSGASLTDCTFRRNNGTGGAGGLANSGWRSLTLNNCTFSENTGDTGGMYCYANRDVTLINCIFKGNVAMDEGGGMRLDTCVPVLVNCVFIGNRANRGGGVRNFLTPMTVCNCTFVANSAIDAGGGMFNHNLSPHDAQTVTNSVFWGNADGGGLDESAQIQNENEVPVDVVIKYSCIEGCSTYCANPDDHNTGADLADNPLFARDPYDGGDGWADDPNTIADESANNDYGDLRLTAGSPCIDAGNNDADTDADTPEIEPLPDEDLAGRPRLRDGDCNGSVLVDIGAYEFSYAPQGDFDGDCTVDLSDFAILGEAWITTPADTKWNVLCDIGFPLNEAIDDEDLLEFAAHWLEDMR